MLFLSIFRPRSVLFKVGILIYEITLTASFVSSPLLFGFVVIRKVGAKWKFIVLVQFQQTSDVCKSLHEVKTPQVSKEFVSLLCTLLFDCLGCLSHKASIKRICLILYRILVRRHRSDIWLQIVALIMFRRRLQVFQSYQLVHVNQVKPISSQAADPPLNLRLIDMSELF